MARRKQQWLPKEGWNYALLLLLLLTTGTLALNAILTYIGTIIPEADLFPVAAALSFMLLGFMLTAGVFALYAIRFSAHAESLRRVNALVNTMDYIRDPVLVLDRNLMLTAANPAARKAFKADELHKRPLATVLPFLSKESIERLRNSSTPAEVEASAPAGQNQTPHTYRVRAYPSAHITVLLITDISGVAGLRARQRQNSYLQLIGHIARGVATDFNDLLCGISGHATLMGRQLPADSPLQSSLHAIVDCTERGIRVGSHLIELASHETYPQNSIAPAEHIDAAVRLLRSGLDDATLVTSDITPPIPILGISGKQLEQTIYSLGLLAVDTLGTNTTLSIQLAPANSTPLFKVPSRSHHAAVLLMHAATGESAIPESLDNLVQVQQAEAGIVESVVDSIVSEIGGVLESYRGEKGMMLYRILLPIGMLTPQVDENGFDMPEELVAYLAGRRLLMASTTPAAEALTAVLIRAGSALLRATDIVALLSIIEQHEDLAAVVLDQELLGQQWESLLRAITKIRPQAGIVIMTPEGSHPDTVADLPKGVLLLEKTVSAHNLQRAILSATNLHATHAEEERREEQSDGNKD